MKFNASCLTTAYISILKTYGTGVDSKHLQMSEVFHSNIQSEIDTCPYISQKSMSFSVPCLIESPTSVSYSRFPTSSFPMSFQITNLKTRCSEMDLSETTLSRQFSAAEIQVLVPVGCRLCLWGIGFFIMIAFWCVSLKSFPINVPRLMVTGHVFEIGHVAMGLWAQSLLCFLRDEISNKMIPLWILLERFHDGALKSCEDYVMFKASGTYGVHLKKWKVPSKQ